jgi:hypothetical protein
MFDSAKIQWVMRISKFFLRLHQKNGAGISGKFGRAEKFAVVIALAAALMSRLIFSISCIVGTAGRKYNQKDYKNNRKFFHVCDDCFLCVIDAAKIRGGRRNSKFFSATQHIFFILM